MFYAGDQIQGLEPYGHVFYHRATSLSKQESLMPSLHKSQKLANPRNAASLTASDYSSPSDSRPPSEAGEAGGKAELLS